MRVLGTTVLTFEWLILALGVPVAINTAGVSVSGAWVFLGFVRTCHRCNFCLECIGCVSPGCARPPQHVVQPTL